MSWSIPQPLSAFYSETGHPRVQLCPVGHPMAGVAIRARRHQPREMQPPDDFNRSISHGRQYARREASCGSVAGSTRLSAHLNRKSPARAEAQRRPSEQLANPPTALSSHPPASQHPPRPPHHRLPTPASEPAATSRDGNPVTETTAAAPAPVAASAPARTVSAGPGTQ